MITSVEIELKLNKHKKFHFLPGKIPSYYTFFKFLQGLLSTSEDDQVKLNEEEEEVKEKKDKKVATCREITNIFQNIIQPFHCAG